jgi:hypothetical protein
MFWVDLYSCPLKRRKLMHKIPYIFVWGFFLMTMTIDAKKTWFATFNNPNIHCSDFCTGKYDGIKKGRWTGESEIDGQYLICACEQ